MATGLLAVLAVQVPLWALLLSVAFLLPKADQAFTRRALSQEERAESFVAVLETKKGSAEHRQTPQQMQHEYTAWRPCVVLLSLLEVLSTGQKDSGGLMCPLSHSQKPGTWIPSLLQTEPRGHSLQLLSEWAPPPRLPVFAPTSGIAECTPGTRVSP